MKDEEQKLQKLYMEFQMISQHIKKLEEQSETINKQMMEFMATNQGLEDFKKMKQGDEILVPINHGIYAKASIKNNEKFIVNVGANVALSKDVGSTQKLIESQISDMEQIQKNLIEQLETQTTKAAELEQEINTIASSIKK